jgi:hypothetical protein
VVSFRPTIVLGSQSGTTNSPTLFWNCANGHRGVASGLTVRPAGRSVRRVLIVLFSIGGLIGSSVPIGPAGISLCWMMYWVKPIGGWPPAIVKNRSSVSSEQRIAGGTSSSQVPDWKPLFAAFGGSNCGSMMSCVSANAVGAANTTPRVITIIAAATKRLTIYSSSFMH